VQLTKFTTPELNGRTGRPVKPYYYACLIVATFPAVVSAINPEVAAKDLAIFVSATSKP